MVHTVIMQIFFCYSSAVETPQLSLQVSSSSTSSSLSPNVPVNPSTYSDIDNRPPAPLPPEVYSCHLSLLV